MCVCISSSYRATCTDFLDSLSLSHSLAIRLYFPSFPVGLRDYILSPHGAVVDKLLLVGQHLHVRVKGPLENVTYEFVLTSPTVSHMSCSFYLEGFKDGR